jgi:hypothetical protein
LNKLERKATSARRKLNNTPNLPEKERMRLQDIIEAYATYTEGFGTEDMVQLDNGHYMSREIFEER